MAAHTKTKIHDAAEEEERRFYDGRTSKDWLDAIAQLGRTKNKPYLEWSIALPGWYGGPGCGRKECIAHYAQKE